MYRFLFAIILFPIYLLSQTNSVNDSSGSKVAIKNNTQPHVVVTSVDLTFNDRRIIALINGSQQVDYKLIGESVISTKEFGNMGLVITNKNILGVSNNSTEFARQPLYGDSNINYTIANSLIFVITNRKIYIYTISSSEWRVIDITGETIRAHAAFDKTGTIITNKRLIAYSETLKDVQFFSIDSFIPIYSFHVLENKIVYDSANKTIIYRPETGEFSIIKMN